MKKLGFLLIVFWAVQVFAEERVFQVDTVASKVEWKGSKKIGGEHFGTVSLQSGSIRFEGNQPVGGEFVLDMNSIDSVDLAKEPKKKAKLEGHLKSKDFFDVESHPTSKFVVKSVKDLGKGKYAFKGELEIRGSKQTQVIEANVSESEESFSASADLTLDRTKYGVVYKSEDSVGFFAKLIGSGKDKIISHDIKLKLDVIAKK